MKILHQHKKLENTSHVSKIEQNLLKCEILFQKTGKAQVGAISKAQKYQKDFKVSFYSTRKTQKLDRIGAPRRTLLNFSSILSRIIRKMKGTLWWKKILEKVSQCQKN